jgi:hypothetical protein
MPDDAPQDLTPPIIIEVGTVSVLIQNNTQTEAD